MFFYVVVVCIFNPLMEFRFYCMALLHSQTRRHMINLFTGAKGIGKTFIQSNNEATEDYHDFCSSKVIKQLSADLTKGSFGHESN